MVADTTPFASSTCESTAIGGACQVSISFQHHLKLLNGRFFTGTKKTSARTVPGCFQSSLIKISRFQLLAIFLKLRVGTSECVIVLTETITKVVFILATKRIVNINDLKMEGIEM